MESESLLPLVRVTVADDREPWTSFLDLIVVLTSKMFCRKNLVAGCAPGKNDRLNLNSDLNASEIQTRQ